MYPRKDKHLTKHFNKIRSRKAAVTPPNLFTITGCIEAYVQDAKHTPAYLCLNASFQQQREYRRLEKIITNIHNELCGCDKFRILRRTTGVITTTPNDQFFDNHDIVYSDDYCLQCKELELMEFHLMMLSEQSFNFK